MATGVIRFVSPRGFGFIRCKDGTDIYFFRPSRAQAREHDVVSPRVGEEVDFRVVQGPRGRHAEDVVMTDVRPHLRPAVVAAS